MPNDYLAHVRQDAAGDWQIHPLHEHLKAVGELAAEFARLFSGHDWARLAGLWHDLGKYRVKFQRRIRHNSGYDPEAHIEGTIGRAPHSTAGAKHAVDKLGLMGRVLAYLIAGHHAGLPDWNSANGGQASLSYRLANADEELRESLAEAVPDDILAFNAPIARIPGGMDGFALWLRMLFSCLVDADFLDTEAFMAPEQAARRGQYPSLAAMRPVFDQHMRDLAAKAGGSPVNTIRADILRQCRAAATGAPGLYTLTVPTGGGKTLASLAFALDHAAQHGKRRIIYAIPYTSIIEQTADIFRQVFEPLGDCVVEHHSNLDFKPEQENHASRLAAENWDAPLIVTTNVQLFESLFAARTSRCRKLHNLAGSIVVLDEAQLLPREFLKPLLQAIRLLAAHYGVTFVLATATQPALGSRFDPVGNKRLLQGLDEVSEIIAQPGALYASLKRTEVRPLHDWRTPVAWPALAARLEAHDCVLTIVNRRDDCRTLYRLLPGDGRSVHLSALMCGEHRSAVIKYIKARLQARREGQDSTPLRVVSTQLVESGVDVDFPVVYRALAGLDSIAQAAGRCNREGKLPGLGEVVVFVPEKPAPAGLLRQGEETAKELMDSSLVTDVLAPESFTRYFDLLYSKGEFDTKGIVASQTDGGGELAVPFRRIAADFQLIEDSGQAVIVRYVPDGASESPVDALLGKLEQDANQKWIYRKLQRYTVNVPQTQFDKMLAQRDIESRGGLYVALAGRYDPVLGLLLPEDDYDPASLVG